MISANFDATNALLISSVGVRLLGVAVVIAMSILDLFGVRHLSECVSFLSDLIFHACGCV